MPIKRLIYNFFIHMGYKVERISNNTNRSKTKRFIYQEPYMVGAINPGDRVLDIGSGGDPFPLATHLCDLRLEISSDRPYDPIVIDERPFILTDIHQMPFKDKTFDFSACCHVLEHIIDPIAACKEIQRISKRGFIETPTFCKDILFGWAKGMHRWHLVSHEKSLLFFEYTQRQIEGCRSSVWKNLITQSTYHPIQDMFYNNQDIFNVLFLWEDVFRVEVFRNGNKYPQIFEP